MKDITERIVNILGITVPKYDEEHKSYYIESSTDNPNVGIVTKKSFFRDQSYAKKQYDFVNLLEELELDNDFLMRVKEIEETDKEIVLRSEIAKSLRKKLKEDLENKMKKLCSPCY